MREAFLVDLKGNRRVRRNPEPEPKNKDGSSSVLRAMDELARRIWGPRKPEQLPGEKETPDEQH
jgi:hypothetical protein